MSKTTFAVWAQGLAAAFISGAAHSIVAAGIDPSTFNLTTGLSKLGTLALLSGAISTALYLTRSPVPDPVPEIPAAAAPVPPAPSPAPVPPALKLPLLIAALLGVALAGTGCQHTSPATQAKISATAAYAGQKTLTVLEGAAFSAAGSLLDEAVSGKAIDYTQGLTVGLRSAEGNLLSSDDVRSLVAIWTKQAPELAPLAVQLAQTYAKANPHTPAQATAALEAIAKGLDDATGPAAAKP